MNHHKKEGTKTDWMMAILNTHLTSTLEWTKNECTLIIKEYDQLGNN